MLFCSQAFLFFFAALLLIYWLMPWQTVRIGLLLVASFYFYAVWNAWLAVLICVTTVMDYLLALGMDRSTSPRRRKLLLAASLIVNIGVLGYFKYANFFLVSLDEALIALGAPMWFGTLSVILPIGISFYTFEAINYTVDVYRSRVPAERNLAHFLLFILFFPHLVAGPIVRARDFLPQIKRRKRFSWPRMHLGAQLFFLGLIKKLAIADRMALYVDPVYADPHAYSTATLWLAAIAYALQIYCDFSGYTDMAIGTAHMLGYKLARNFDIPYASLNITEFWRRWHISLSSWLRDYLFIPLGGSRGGAWRTYRNLLVTMTLCGLWHGASWNFVLFGLLHGCALIIHRMFQGFCASRPRLELVLQSLPGVLLRMVLTFGTFCFTLVFFRAPTLSAAATMLRRLAAFAALPAETPMPNTGVYYTIAVVIVCHMVRRFDLWPKLQVRLPASILGFSYAAAVTLALLLAPSGNKPFIYFQF
ncbi:MAG TPA: MBOAT family protein [Gemmataceae bacterium]|nr:MBOAT family protein [Gemmataceae bacterium]